VGENHEIILLYVKNYIKEAPTSNSLATTGRRIQPPIFSGYKLSEAPNPQFFGYN
jgi:hypothetical protein